MGQKTWERLTGEVEAMCREHGCREKVRKIHVAQYVNRGWHPHPPQDFKAWWATHQDFRQGIEVKRAYNCQRYRNQFLELKQVGAA